METRKHAVYFSQKNVKLFGESCAFLRSCKLGTAVATRVHHYIIRGRRRKRLRSQLFIADKTEDKKRLFTFIKGENVLRERKCFLVRKLQSLLEDAKRRLCEYFPFFCCRFVHFCAYYTTYCIRNDVLLAWIFFCLSKVPPRSRQKKEQIFHHAFSRKKKEKICFLWCEIYRGRKRKKHAKSVPEKSFLCFF